MMAAVSGHEGVVQRLLEHNANTEIQDEVCCYVGMCWPSQFGCWLGLNENHAL